MTFILLVDDFFLIHDGVFPKVLHLSEKLVYLFYLVAFSLFFTRNFTLILKETEYRILVLGLFLMGMSVLTDLGLFPGGIDVEDSYKILGMTAYSYYWVVTSHGLVSRSVVPG